MFKEFILSFWRHSLTSNLKTFRPSTFSIDSDSTIDPKKTKLAKFFVFDLLKFNTCFEFKSIFSYLVHIIAIIF